jgi:hypothetical protein
LPEVLFTLGVSRKGCCGSTAYELQLSPGEGEWSGELVGGGQSAVRTRAVDGAKNLEAEL